MAHTLLDHLILTLSLIDGVGPVTIAQIVEMLTVHQVGDPKHLSVRDWMQFGCTTAVAQLVTKAFSDQRLVYEELELIHKHAIFWLTIADSSYPTSLKAIYAPPAVLYWRGAHPNAHKKMIAMVGSRQANSYGQQVVDRCVPALIAHGWATVSGGAIGADTMVHRTTLAHQGQTIAVIGSGLLKPYPVRNHRLFEDIVVHNGTVLSIFPLLEQAHTGSFPARNRIIAGLSRGCVVVQAAHVSGARITAQYALDEGRSVFAVPGAVDDPLSQGCHELIREGAILARDANDILSEFGEQINNEQLLSQSEPVTVQDRLVQLCKQPHSLDELAHALQLSMTALQTELFSLQLAGKIDQQFTGKWVSL